MTTLFFLILALILVSIVFAFLSLAPWLPTRKKDLPRILALASLGSNEFFYDLGCGTGGVALYVYKNSPAQVVGVELAWPLYLVCKIRQSLNISKRLKFKFNNLYWESLRPAGVVYLFPASRHHISNKLKQKLNLELTMLL